MNPSKTIRRQPDLVQQALFYKGFVELFGWQHSGNGWQHVAGFIQNVTWVAEMRPAARHFRVSACR